MNESGYASVAESAGLARVGGRPPLGAYIKETWERRAFAITLARYRISSANESNRLGLAWIVLRPLLNAAIYGVLFGVVLKTSRIPDNAFSFIAFLIVGVFIFEYFSDAFGDGSKAVIGNASLIRSLSFPRILLPISTLLQSLFELIPMIVVMLVIIVIMGERPQWTWLMLIPILALMTLFNAGIAFIAARLTVHFPDFKQMVPFISRIFFYATGIFFYLDSYLADKPPIFLLISRLNPIHDYVALARVTLVAGFPPEPIYWVVGIIGAFVVFIVGFIYFWWAEEEYGRD